MTIPVKIGDTVAFTGGYVYVALLTEDGEYAYPMATCKEYVLDYTLYTLRGQQSSMYSSNNGKMVCTKEVRLAVAGLGEYALNSLDLINKFDHALDIPLTEMQGYDERVVIFRGNKRWMNAPPMLSLFSLLVRAGRLNILGKTLGEMLEWYWTTTVNVTVPTYDKFGRMSDDYIKSTRDASDVSYMKQARKGIEYILQHGDRAIFGEEIEKNWKTGADIHNRGIITFGTGGLKTTHSAWYKLKGL